MFSTAFSADIALYTRGGRGGGGGRESAVGGGRGREGGREREGDWGTQ